MRDQATKMQREGGLQRGFGSAAAGGGHSKAND